MTPEKVIQLAKQAGIKWDEVDDCSEYRVGMFEFRAFAALVVESCAEVVDKLADGGDADTAQQFALDIASDNIRNMKS